MTKSDMITLIAQRCGASRSLAGQALDDLFGSIAVQIAAGAVVRLPALGAIEAYPTLAKPGRNPRTGQSITIAAGHRFKFRPSSELRDLTAAATRAEAAE